MPRRKITFKSKRGKVTFYARRQRKKQKKPKYGLLAMDLTKRNADEQAKVARLHGHKVIVRPVLVNGRHGYDVFVSIRKMK